MNIRDKNNRIKLTLLVAVSLIGIAGLLVLPDKPAAANGLSIAPLKYQSNLNGKVKKGTVDIVNSSGFAQTIEIKVQSFKQIDNKGTLQFYDDPAVEAGIITDYTRFLLGPHQAMHLFFELDGSKLPKKRLFAAILAEAKPVKAGYNITPVLRVGTLLLLKNGDGDPPKQGVINKLHIPMFQYGGSVNGSFNFKNTEKGEDASGYFPEFKVELAGSSSKFSGRLVFPGINRPQQFSLSGSHIGIYKLKLTSDANTHAEQWIIVITGFWCWLLPLLLIGTAVLILLAVRLRGIGNHRNRKKKK